MMEFVYALASVILVSLVSLIGIATFSVKEKELRKYLLFIVAFAAGTLLAAAFFDLIPEAVELLENEAFFYVLSGVILFLFIESFVHWHHCMKEECEVHSKQAVGFLNLIGDGIHNFIAGVMIAASYLVSIPLGISATIAILAHEIPQEMGDFAILLHSGFTRKKALLYNFLSAITALIGMLAGFFFLQSFSTYIPYALSIGAGGFIYIALADLFPEINKSRNLKNLVIQTIAVVMGILLIFVLMYSFPE